MIQIKNHHILKKLQEKAYIIAKICYNLREHICEGMIKYIFTVGEVYNTIGANYIYKTQKDDKLLRERFCKNRTGSGR